MGAGALVPESRTIQTVDDFLRLIVESGGEHIEAEGLPAGVVAEAEALRLVAYRDHYWFNSWVLTNAGRERMGLPTVPENRLVAWLTRLFVKAPQGRNA